MCFSAGNHYNKKEKREDMSIRNLIFLSPHIDFNCISTVMSKFFYIIKMRRDTSSMGHRYTSPKYLTFFWLFKQF